VWRLEKARESVLARTGVPRSDKGIDLLAEDYDGNDWAIQAKYRTDEDVALGWKKDLSTFHLTHSSR
jgi:predicted helicase